jgi:hypothetical protein
VRASFSSRRTTSGSRNPIVADADAGVVGIVVVVNDRGFARCGARAAAALSMLSTRQCPSSLCAFIRLPAAFALELAIFCAMLGLRLAMGCGGRTGVHARICIFSSSVSHSSPNPNPNLSPTPLLLWPFLCCVDLCRPTERAIVRSMESSSSASLAPTSSSSSSPTNMRGRGGDADMPGFMMGSPNATVYRLRGVELILDDLVHVGCCGGAGYVPPVRSGGTCWTWHGGRRKAGNGYRSRPHCASAGGRRRSRDTRWR